MSDAAGLDVRVMRPGEFDAVRALAVSAFGGSGSFGADDGIGDLLDALRASWAWADELSFVAERSGRIVGQVLYTRALVDAPLRLVEVLVLSPVSVRLDERNRGIGSALLQRSLAALAGRPEPAVFLEGHPRFFSRVGFAPAGDLGFAAPSARIAPEAFLVRPLPRYDPALRGALVYPDAFWRTDRVGLRLPDLG
jgi:putative acetyltransferase